MTPPQAYAEQQREEFKQQFRQRRRRQLIATAPLLAAMALSFWLRRRPDAALAGLPLERLLPYLVVGLVAFIAFTLVNRRCPACRGYLGKGVGPRFCRKCGVALA